jgi:hypothetical protein
MTSVKRIARTAAALPAALLVAACARMGERPPWWGRSAPRPISESRFCGPRKPPSAKQSERTPEAIQARVREHYASLQSCYQAALSRRLDAEGEVTTRFVIDRDGIVRGTCIEDADLNDDDAIGCMLDTFSAVRFGPAQGEVTVIYPIRYAPRRIVGTDDAVGGDTLGSGRWTVRARAEAQTTLRAAQSSSSVLALIVGCVLGGCGDRSQERFPDGGNDGGAGGIRGGSSLPMCSESTADCNGDTRDSCEVDTTRHGEHCGACERDCVGGPCVSGSCGTPPELLAEEQDGLCAMVSDDETVFWANCRGGSVVSMPTTGGQPLTVSVGQGWIYDMAIDDEAVYWTARQIDSGGIKRRPKLGGSVELVVRNSAVWSVAADADRIYWTQYTVGTSGEAEGGVLSASKTGTMTHALANTPAQALALDTDNVYWSDPATNELKRTSKSGEFYAVLASTSGYVNIVTHAGFVYFLDSNGTWRVPAAGGTKESAAGGEGLTFVGDTMYYVRSHELVVHENEDVTPLAWLKGSVGGIAVGGGFLHWGDFNENTVSWIALTATNGAR